MSHNLWQQEPTKKASLQVLVGDGNVWFEGRLLRLASDRA
jgi:hypothetical protein